MNDKFCTDELKVLGNYPVVERDFMTVPGVFTTKLNTPITPKENWRRFFKRENPLWVPDGSYDVNYLSPYPIPDSQACSHAGGFDSFGVKWIPVENCPDLPAFVEPGFQVLKDIADWRELPWPKVESWDWEKAAEDYKVLDPDRPNAVFMATGLFERMISLMGFEDAAASFLEDPDSVHDFLDRLLEYNLAVIEHLHKYIHMDLLVFSDDWGAQRSPFFSKAVVEEFLVPHMTELVKETHRQGMWFMHHCCGNVTSLVPYMIDEGVDSWQFNYEAVRQDLPETIEKYGDKILFDGYFGFLEPLPPDEKEFKKGVDYFYRTYGSTGKCSVTVYDFNQWDFDSRAYSYEAARKAMTSEL